MDETVLFADRPIVPDMTKAEKFFDYDVITVSLAVAHTNFRFQVAGNFLQVYAMTTGASMNLSFNQMGKNIPFDGEQHIFMPFTSFYLTNTAQAGATVTFFVGRGVYFVPFYRTQSISPKTDTIKQYAVASGAAAVAFSAAYAADFAGKLVTRIDIYNPAAGNDAVIGNSAVTAADGMDVVAGQFYSLNFTPHYLATNVYHLSTLGTTLKILVYGVA